MNEKYQNKMIPRINIFFIKRSLPPLKSLAIHRTILKKLYWFVINPDSIGPIVTLMNIAQLIDRDACDIFPVEKARPDWVNYFLCLL